MELRLENFLLPALEKAQKRSGNIKDVKQEEIPKATSSLSDRDNKTSILGELKKLKHSSAKPTRITKPTKRSPITKIKSCEEILTSFNCQFCHSIVHYVS